MKRHERHPKAAGKTNSDGNQICGIFNGLYVCSLDEGHLGRHEAHRSHVLTSDPRDSWYTPTTEQEVQDAIESIRKAGRD